MLTRPPLRPAIAMREPVALGAEAVARPARGTSSKMTWRVGWAFQPIFCSFGAEATGPARPVGTTNARDAAWRRARPCAP